MAPHPRHGQRPRDEAAQAPDQRTGDVAHSANHDKARHTDAPAATRAGRFAPSPTGDLHLGNLRTALLAYLFARTTGRDFLLRVEDLDRVRAGSADRQLADLRALGLDWDGPVTYQSERYPRYTAALTQLADAGLTYECYCTRREITEAASAPHAGPGDHDVDKNVATPPGAYPGTCRDLTEAERRARRASGRPAAIRLRAQVPQWTVSDELAGETTFAVDDLVLRRNDGVVSYNLAVVVDDALQHIDQVVRGDDLLSSAPRQAYLAHVLNHPQPSYAHVPLARNADGDRLAKRDGAVTLEDLAQHGMTAPAVRSVLAASLGLAEPGEPVTVAELVARFDPAGLPRQPWVVDPQRVIDGAP